MRRLFALSLALACATDPDAPPDTAGDESGGETTGDESTSGESTASEPEPCPLLGVFRGCDAAGRQWCDEIDGTLQWGPCLDAFDCELTDPHANCTMCTLVDGIPTIVPEPEPCGGSTGAGP